MTNTGTANLTVSAATITPAGPFSVVTNGCTAAVAPAGTCTITVGFRPTTTATVTAQLSIAHNAAGSPTVITLTGQGRTPVAQPAITIPATTAFNRTATRHHPDAERQGAEQRPRRAARSQRPTR